MYDLQYLSKLAADADFAANAPGGLYQEATWCDIGNERNATAQEMTGFLLRKIDPNGLRLKGSVTALRQAILDDIDDARGNEAWIAAFGVPRVLPESRDHHRLLNLMERLYLTAPGNYGKKSLFGDKAADRTFRTERILGRSAGAGASWVMLMGTGFWIYRRRKMVKASSI